MKQASVFDHMAEMHRADRESRMVIHEPDPAWSDPDGSLHYPNMEAFDSLCISESAAGEPLYYGYTFYQINEMAEWSLTGLERNLIAKSVPANDATGHLLNLVRHIRHKQEQAANSYDPFALVKMFYPEMFTEATVQDATKLLVMPKQSKPIGRPKRDQLEMLKAYYFRHLFYPTSLYNVLERQTADNPLSLLPRDEIKPMPYTVLAQVMNVGKTDLGKRVGESKEIAAEYSRLKAAGVRDALDAEAYRKMCDAAKAEIAKDPDWFEKAQDEIQKILGVDTYDEWLAMNPRPPILGIDRESCKEILCIVLNDAVKCMFSNEQNPDYKPEIIH